MKVLSKKDYSITQDENFFYIFDKKEHTTIIENSSIEDNIRKIIMEYAKLNGIEYDVLISKSRKSPISDIRQAAMYAIKTKTKYSFKKTGSYFASKDHSTVVHACRMVENRIQTKEADTENYLTILSFLFEKYQIRLRNTKLQPINEF